MNTPFAAPSARAKIWGESYRLFPRRPAPAAWVHPVQIVDPLPASLAELSYFRQVAGFIVAIIDLDKSLHYHLILANLAGANK